MFKKMNEKQLLQALDGKGIDFYLEDDMFEIEGVVKSKDEKIIIEVLSAVGHILEMTGKLLEVKPKYEKLYAEKIDKSRTFEMEINRTYHLLEEPIANDFAAMKKERILEFFKKITDTLVWFDEDTNAWFIELNKINMCYSGDRKSYPSIEELFEKNQEHMSGKWQAIYYSSECEEV
ncbi:hypothetical protein QBE52_03785 [Clostridiaceae bacterium 35-E11]